MVLSFLASLQALELGPLSYTTVICSLSTLIPTLSDALLRTVHHLLKGVLLFLQHALLGWT